MIDVPQAAEIIATYRKYGWILRRILLTNPETGALLAKSTDLGEAAIVPAPIDAAWFSRPPKEGPVPWEIRYLGKTPFALLESLSEKEADFEYLLSATEARLRESIAAKEAS
jgi:hypothetical protein